MRRAAILLALTAALLALAVPAYARADKDCRDFASHDEAQAYFEANGGSPSNNVDRLDGDGDGIACEDRPGGGTGSDNPADGNDQGEDKADDAPTPGKQGDTPADQGERLASTGSGDVTRTAGAGLLVGGLLLVVATRYRGRHAK